MGAGGWLSATETTDLLAELLGMRGGEEEEAQGGGVREGGGAGEIKMLQQEWGLRDLAEELHELVKSQLQRGEHACILSLVRGCVSAWVDSRSLFLCMLARIRPTRARGTSPSLTAPLSRSLTHSVSLTVGAGDEVRVEAVETETRKLERVAEEASLAPTHWSRLRLLAAATDILTALDAPRLAACYARKLGAASEALVCDQPLLALRLHIKVGLALARAAREEGQEGQEVGEGGERGGEGTQEVARKHKTPIHQNILGVDSQMEAAQVLAVAVPCLSLPPSLSPSLPPSLPPSLLDVTFCLVSLVQPILFALTHCNTRLARTLCLGRGGRC